MQLILIAIAISGGIYFLGSRRRFDLFAVAFLSCCIYFLPGYVGHVRDGALSDVPVPIETETYAVMATVMLAILLGARFFDSRNPVQQEARPAVANPYATYVALCISVIGLALTLRIGKEALFSHNKEVVMTAITRWFQVYAFGAGYAAVSAFLHRQWKSLAIAFVLLLFTVYVGFRSICALTVIAIFLMYFHQQGRQCFATKNRTSVVVASLAASFFFVYKFVYRIVKLNDTERLLSKLGDPEFYLSTVMESEPFATQMVLNETVRTDFATGGGYLVESVAGQFLLFGNELGIGTVSFNHLFQPALVPEVQGGLAGNIWAQMLAAGGWPLLLAFLLVFVAVLYAGSRLLRTRRLGWRAAIALCSSYWCFYIHRNDIGFELTLLKRILLVWALAAFVSSAICYFGRAAAGGTPRSRTNGTLLGMTGRTQR